MSLLKTQPYLFMRVFLKRSTSRMTKQRCVWDNKNCHPTRKLQTVKYNKKNVIFHERKVISKEDCHLCSRAFSRTACCLKDESIFTDKESGESIEEELNESGLSEEDLKYQQLLREYCEISGTGHQVLVIQPDIKKGRSKPVLTTADLQLEEACALVETLPKWRVIKKMIVPVYEPRSQELFRSSRLNDIKNEIKNNKHITAVFISSNHLYRYQISYLQAFLNVPLVDRYQLVLHIFKEHAQTKEAKLQVALAEIPFIRKHLEAVSEGTHDLQTGSHHYIGGMFSHISKRQCLLKEKESKLRKELIKVKRQREMVRRSRQTKRIPTVAVVGYTNCGKTTLIKSLTGDEDMVPKDQLFATLDVTAHGGIMKSKVKVVYMDTVGFISNIPFNLIEAFSATLEDALIADVIIHLKDVSHPDFLAQELNVKKTLANILPEEKLRKVITVGNKIDQVDRELLDLEPGCVYISAATGQGLSVLEDRIHQALIENTGLLEKKIRIPTNGPQLEWLYKMATVRDAVGDTDSEHLIVNIVINENIYEKFKAHFGKPTTRKCKVDLT